MYIFFFFLSLSLSLSFSRCITSAKFSGVQCRTTRHDLPAFLSRCTLYARARTCSLRERNEEKPNEAKREGRRELSVARGRKYFRTHHLRVVCACIQRTTMRLCMHRDMYRVFVFSLFRIFRTSGRLEWYKRRKAEGGKRFWQKEG